MELILFKTLTLLFSFIGIINATERSCQQMVETLHNDTLILKELESLNAQDLASYTSNFDCLEQLIRINAFESSKFMLTQQFVGKDSDARTLNKAQSIVQSAINFVKSQQTDVMAIFENTQQMSSFSDNIPIVTPAIRWAQSPNTTYIEVKFSTRFDSPACLDVFDQEITLVNRSLTISAMCRNDKKLLKYQLTMELYGNVGPFEISDEAKNEFKALDDTYQADRAKFDEEMEKYNKDNDLYKKMNEEYIHQQDLIKNGDGDLVMDEMQEPTEPEKPELMSNAPKKLAHSNYNAQSVGRILFNFEKPVDYRWRTLNMKEFGVKGGNVQRWWEQHEKFEKDLVELQPYEDDDEEFLKNIDDSRKPWIENRPKKSKKNKNKKKNHLKAPKKKTSEKSKTKKKSGFLDYAKSWLKM